MDCAVRKKVKWLRSAQASRVYTFVGEELGEKVLEPGTLEQTPCLCNSRAAAGHADSRLFRTIRSRSARSSPEIAAEFAA